MKISNYYNPYIPKTENHKVVSNYNFKSSAQSNCLDIKSRGKFPANILSNFSGTDFIFDGVKIKSIEGFLQSLKTGNQAEQQKICAMNGFDAKKASHSLKPLKSDELSFWQGKTYSKHSPELKEIINKSVEISKKNPNEPFIYEGIKFNSVNNFIQALKVSDQKEQARIGAIPVGELKEQSKNISSVYNRTLYWKGQAINRFSQEYKDLLKRVYTERFKNDSNFRTALRIAQNYTLTHSIGKNNPYETILTENEFISLLKDTMKQDNIGYKVKDFFIQSLKLTLKACRKG